MEFLSNSVSVQSGSGAPEEVLEMQGAGRDLSDLFKFVTEGDWRVFLGFKDGPTVVLEIS